MGLRAARAAAASAAAAGGGAAAATPVAAAPAPHRSRPEADTRVPTPRHPFRRSAPSPGFETARSPRRKLRREPSLLNLPAASRSSSCLARPSAVNFVSSGRSAKIVRLLRRVVGVRASLTIESRLPMGADGPVRPHHTQDMSWETRSARRPAPGRIVGPTPPASDPRKRVAERKPATRPTAGVGSAGGRDTADRRKTGRTMWHETKDERDLWRDRRSASGSRPMTTR